jgi:hypothetical protein
MPPVWPVGSYWPVFPVDHLTSFTDALLHLPITAARTTSLGPEHRHDTPKKRMQRCPCQLSLLLTHSRREQWIYLHHLPTLPKHQPLRAHYLDQCSVALHLPTLFYLLVQNTSINICIITLTCISACANIKLLQVSSSKSSGSNAEIISLVSSSSFSSRYRELLVIKGTQEFQEPRLGGVCHSMQIYLRYRPIRRTTQFGSGVLWLCCLPIFSSSHCGEVQALVQCPEFLFWTYNVHSHTLMSYHHRPLFGVSTAICAS